MTPKTRQFFLGLVALLSAMLLVLVLTERDIATEEKRPEDLEGLATWLERHPADWLAASATTDRSLDSELPRRVELWRNAHALAQTLAPHRTHPAAGFVRAGLFHWYELGDADRKAVLEAAAPLLRDELTFARMYRNLWQLTRDLGYLRRVAPPTITAQLLLRDLAAMHGRFADYRELREAERAARLAEFQRRREHTPIGDLLGLLPESFSAADTPLVRAVLEELDRRPFEAAQMRGPLDALTRFAIAHHVQPLSGLAPLVPLEEPLRPETRARLARALGDPAAALRVEAVAGLRAQPRDEKEWTGLCEGGDLCASAVTTRPLREVNVAVAQSDEIPPYVEIYVNDTLIAEGEVRGRRTFAISASNEAHRTEVRLVNRRTRNGIQRRVRLS